MEEVRTYITKTNLVTRVHEVTLESKIPKNWQIKYSNNISIPKFLIKYYSADLNGFNVLRKNEIWASNPFSFNDPFDCSIQMWDIDLFQYNEMKQFVEEFIFFGQKSELNIYDVRKIFFELVLRMVGIYCLSEKVNSDLFWGYYNNHKGFSIEFDEEILNETFNCIPYKIEYKEFERSDKIAMTYNDLEDGNIYAKILRWCTLKKGDWLHENEWRYLFMDINIGNTNRKRPFPLKAINVIVLGYKFFSEADDKWVNSSVTEYTFNKKVRFNYAFKILYWLYKRPEIKIKRVVLTEDFKLLELEIRIQKIEGNVVAIERIR